jgi:nitrite reductase/ring-hydroxylating ferredoxin subunit
MKAHRIASLEDIPEREPFGALVENVDLVIVREGEELSALYGRCPHRGAMLADGRVAGDDLICGVHG